MNEILGIIIAAVLCWLNFVLIDTWMGLPEKPGVKGADVIGRDVKKRGGDLSGGFFQGNIVCSPDASAGTLLGAIACYTIGIPAGGFIAALLVFIGIPPEQFVVGMLLAIVTIQGLDHPRASKLLGKIAKKMGRYTELT